MRVPKYRLHKASGQAAVVFSGVWRYLGPYDSPESHALYNKLVAEWVANGGRAPAEARPDLTVLEVLAAYLRHAAAVVGRSQMNRIKRALRPARELYGAAPAAEFKGKALKACRAVMVGWGYNRRHVNHLTGCLKKCWRWALSEELVPAEAAQSVLAVAGLRKGETSAPEPGEVGPAGLEAFEATLPYLPPVVADMARVQLLAGMRPGEVVRLKGDEIDRAADDLWVWRPGEHKTAWRGHKRQVFLGPKAIEIVRPYLERVGGYVFVPPAGGMGRPSKGDRYRGNSYSRIVKVACGRAGAEPWTPLSLRHLAATRIVEKYGWEIGRIYLGHRSISTTRVYAVDGLERVTQAVREMG
jgi:integrase